MSLHVAYVVEAYPTFVVSEVRELRRQGVEVTLLSAFRPVPQKDPDAQALGAESLYFPSAYRGVLGANLRSLLRHPLRYLSCAWLLLAHGESLRLLILAAWFAPILTARGIRHAHGTFGTRTTSLALVVARLTGGTFGFTVHAYDLFITPASLAWKAKRTAYLRTISEFNRSFLVDNVPGLDPGCIRVVRLGVDLARLRAGAGSGTSGRIVSVASGLVPTKGTLYLIEACAELQRRGVDFELDIVGDGPARGALEALVARLGLRERVTFSGRLTHAETLQRVSVAAVFALPCVDERPRGGQVEGLPVAIMEAMALERPVVSTRVSAIPELVEHGESGLLVAERHPVGLADALESLLRAPDAARRLGIRARERIESRYDLGANVSTLIGVLRETA